MFFNMVLCFLCVQTNTFSAQTANFIMMQFRLSVQRTNFTNNAYIGTHSDSFSTTQITSYAQTECFHKGS